MPSNPGVVIVFGLPASGKGTYAGRLGKYYGVPHLTMSSLLREAAESDPGIGAGIQAAMPRHALVPDEIALNVLVRRLQQPDCVPGVILDGFPRNARQAHMLQEALGARGTAVSHAVWLGLPLKAAAKRLADRMSCQKCNVTYSLSDFPPKKAGQCDRCGSPLVKRPDDTPAAIDARLRAERENLREMILFYKGANVLRVLHAKGGRSAFAQNLRVIVNTIGRRRGPRRRA